MTKSQAFLMLSENRVENYFVIFNYDESKALKPPLVV